MRIYPLLILLLMVSQLEANWTTLSSPSTELSFSSSANVDHGLWIYTSTNSSSLFFHSSDQGSQFSSKPTALFEVSHLHIDGTGQLYAYDETKHEIYRSNDQGSNWTDLSENSPPSLNSASIFASSSSSLWIQHRDGITRCDINDTSLSYTHLLSESNAYPSASLNGQQLDVVYIKNSQLLHLRSLDAGQTWQNANTILSSLAANARVSGLHFRNSLDGHVLFIDNQTLMVYHSMDEGKNWSASTITTEQKSSGVYRYTTIRDLETLYYETSSQAVVASRSSYSSDWNRLSVSSFSGNTISASVHEDGKWFIASDTQQLLRLNDPFTLFPLSQVSVLRDWKSTQLHWLYHPLADQYQIAIDGTQVATVTLPPYNYEGRLADNSNISITPLQSGTAGLSKSLSHQAGSFTELEMLIEASSNTSGGFKMLSFPVSSYIVDRDSKLAPLEYFETFLGAEHDPSIWRLGLWEPTAADYIYGTSIKTIDSARSYWHISAFNMAFKVQVENPEASALLTRIRPGWNMVATPYSSSTDWKAMKVYEGLREWSYSELSQNTARIVFPELWEWDGSQYRLSETLVPGKGYWLNNNSTKDLMLSLSKPGTQSSLSKTSSPRYASGQTPPAPPTSTLSNTAASSGGGGGCLMKRYSRKPNN